MAIVNLKRGLLLGMSCVLAACTQVYSSENAYAQDFTAVDKVFKSIKKDTPGCGLGIMKDEALIYENAYGLANLEHNIPNTTDTVFRIASTSKQFTAMSTLILAEEGEISLDDDIRKYVPEMPDYGATITIRHLVNHTSGIRDFLTLFFLKGYKDQDYYTETELLEMLSRQENLDFMPGEKMSYSNSGYVLQSMIIERVTGKTLAEYADDKIFKPLKMKNTHFHNDVTHLVKNRAYGYNPGEKSKYKVGGTPQELIGDGGVFTTIADLALFDEDFYKGKVWHPELKKAMITPGKLNDGSDAAFFPGVYYASGLIVGENRGIPYVRHAGQFAGFITDFIRYPDHKLSIAVLCNSGGLIATDFTAKISDILLEEHYTKPAEPEEEESSEDIKPKKISTEIMSAVSGRYYNKDLDVTYEFKQKGKSLILMVGNRPTTIDFAEMGLPIFDLGDDTLGNEHIQIKLIKDNEGAVTDLDFTLSIVKNLQFKRID